MSVGENQSKQAAIALIVLTQHIVRVPSISFHATTDDVVAASRLHFARTLKTKRWIRSYSMAFVLLAALAALFAWDSEPGERLISFCLILLFWTALLGLTLLIKYLLIPRRVRRVFAQQKSLHDEMHVDWSETAISFKSSRGSFEMQWVDYFDFSEDSKIILLLQSEHLYNFIPKRVLSLEQLRDIMKHSDR